MPRKVPRWDHWLPPSLFPAPGTESDRIQTITLGRLAHGYTANGTACLSPRDFRPGRISLRSVAELGRRVVSIRTDPYGYDDLYPDELDRVRRELVKRARWAQGRWRKK